ncbi:HTH-type transcriptional regulator XynR [Achromobacter deleyi]|uniref:HTH-type transcriptional regulator XynR n=1 Tax=Achromobacter deleyi TaxID=1353891 RepID=A0A6S7BHC8_9BURK|nr:HTH-type transcriptional regulator XynR [Achromobacter deleyi]CAB3886373.1 HTH-type transcriptional regulator XynR [Achromobacter deleyi]CAB3887400.1 HTH-type transcriptional regulator XynR [Achromobacter deleyi]
MPATAQVAGTAAFSKFVHLLQLVADRDTAMTVAELCKVSGYPRPTVYRTVYALIAEGLLSESVVSGRLELGPRLIQLANRSWKRSDLRLLAMADLTRLRDITGETVHLAVPNADQMVYIEKLESPKAVRMTSRVGTSVAMHSSSVGKAYLAFLDEAPREQLLRELPQPWKVFTPQTLTDVAALRVQLERYRERGWAIDDEEQEAGIRCFGAPIFGKQGAPVACISVSTLLFRQEEDVQRKYVAPLLEACRSISRLLQDTPASYSAEAP